ncbi:MAG: OmpA family protein [Ignavibacteria bacterium]|jgi:outer membrane protein OmpA-like peptidoglycan-associated protein
MNKIVVVLMISFILTIAVNGQQSSRDVVHPYSNSWVFTLEGGLTLGFSDYSKSKIDGLILGGIEYYFKRTTHHIFGIKVFGGGQRISGEDDRTAVSTSDGIRNPLSPVFVNEMYILGIAGIYSYAIEDKYFPFIQMGGSYLLQINPKDENGVKLPGLRQGLYDRNVLVLDLNVGAKILLNEKISILFSTGIHITGTDYLDDIATGDVEDHYLTGLLGVSISPFGPGDSDDDGILNEFDACPDQKEDVDGFEDEDGCPDLDNDSDGIPDAEDNCPSSPEDFDGYADSDGCADPDNDLDGILDIGDECPDVAEDIDGFLDEDGCPDADNDADGIPDVIDDCPNQAETPNGFEDNDGCPDQFDVVSVKRITIYGEEIFYANTSAIKPEGIERLNQVVETISFERDSKWRIEGHMDSQGSEQFIRRVSLDRAEAVRDYLVSKGLSADRFTLYGMSDDYPIGDNTTAEGRSKNRRIEIIREF